MRILLILRGNYYCGQKEWIRQNSLKDYVLDFDDFRFLAHKYKNTANIYKTLEYKNDSYLKNIFLEFLDFRMQNGEFCIVNAPNSNNNILKDYKNLAGKNNYKIYIINFTDYNLDRIKAINLYRAKKYGVFIPNEILDKIDKQLLTNKIQKKYEILDKDNWQEILYKPQDLSFYKKIHHIGDIQGCYSVLKKYIKNIKDDEFYIFLGDYIDRGIENAKVLKYLLKIRNLKNVCLLEGNHERHLIKWANDEDISYKEFSQNTLKEFKKEGITIEDAKKFYLSLKECFFYIYNDKKVFCSHGGINFFPKDFKHLSFIPSNSFIYGVGTYKDSKIIAEQFCENSPNDTYQIFGHRNRFDLPIQVAKRAFLCEGKVDSGGYLRVVCLDKNGFECIQIKNNIYKKD